MRIPAFQVTRLKLWRTVGLTLGAPEVCSSVSFVYKAAYERVLLEFERTHPVPLVTNPPDPIKKNKAGPVGNVAKTLIYSIKPGVEHNTGIFFEPGVNYKEFCTNTFFNKEDRKYAKQRAKESAMASTSIHFTSPTYTAKMKKEAETFMNQDELAKLPESVPIEPSRTHRRRYSLMEKHDASSSQL